MTAQPLVVTFDLDDFPGGPFTDAVVDAASEAVRLAAGWHIAPSVTETLKVKAEGATLVLPTLHVTAITAVRDVCDPANPVVMANYEWTPNGVVTLNCYSWSPWRRSGTFEVDLTHGYDTCPPDVLATVAQQAQNIAIDRTYNRVGPFSLADPAPLAVSRRLPARP